MPTEIHRATLRDLVDAAVLGKRFHKEGGVPGEFNARHFVQTWVNLLQTPEATMLVAKSGDEIVGGIGGIIFPCPVTADRVAQEFFWFVDQAHRGGRVAWDLLQRFEEWAKRGEAKRVNMVALGKLNSEKLARFYEKRGYQFMETVFWKDL